MVRASPPLHNPVLFSNKKNGKKEFRAIRWPVRRTALGEEMGL